MGVVHKLKQEVVDFILQQKQENPSLSCRQLSELVTEKFQKKVSKSSVNTILKKANLSSAVGRRSFQESSSKKFQIPEKTKEQLSKQVREVSPHSEESSVAAPRERTEQKEPPATDVKEEQPEESPPVPKPSPLEESYMKKVAGMRARRISSNAPDYKGMGYVFLKAAQWEMSDHSILGELLKKHGNGALPKNFDDICEILIGLSLAGMEKTDEIQQFSDHCLWPLNDVRSENSPALFEDISAPPNIGLEYLNEKNQALLEIKGYSLLLADGTLLTLDAQMSSLWRGRISPILSFPMNKAIATMSRRIISNVEPVLLCRGPEDPGTLDDFYDLVAAFEAIPSKKIEKASLISSKGDVLTEFSAIPNQKRNFMVGIWPAQRIFNSITKPTKWAGKKLYYHELTDNLVHYTETKTDFLRTQFDENIGDLRVMTLWEKEENEPILAILTNFMELEAEKALDLYVSDWPNLARSQIISFIDGQPIAVPDERGENMAKSSQAIDFRKVKDIFEIIKDYGASLKNVCHNDYFHGPTGLFDINISELINYDLKGKVLRADGLLRIVLSIPMECPHLDALTFAIQRVNERRVVDHKKCRLFIEKTP